MHRAIGTVLLFIAVGCAGPAAPESRVRDSADPVNVGFLLVDGVYGSELVAPFDIFHHTIFHTDPGMRVFTVGRTDAPVTTFEGLRIEVDHRLGAAPPIDVLVVPSAEGSLSTDLEDEKLIDWVRTRGESADWVLSVCDGAFLLAEAGLLDDVRSTTFPGDLTAYRERYPHLDVVEGVTYVADGNAITGVGGARSYEPALHLVEKLYGAEVARRVARGMVIEWDSERIPHLAMPEGETPLPSFLPGETIAPETAFEVADGKLLQLETLRAITKARAVVLCFLGGAAATEEPARGGLWCEDSFHDLSLVRRLHTDYAARGVLFVGIFSPPVHHEERFGFRAGSFLTRGDDDPVYQEDRATFVARTEALRAEGRLPFDAVVYDPRLRALADPRQALPAPATGPAPPWQGRFKWFGDPQMYGTPTMWVLDGSLRVVGPPFIRNNYESKDGQLRYGDVELRSRLESALQR